MIRKIGGATVLFQSRWFDRYVRGIAMQEHGS